MGSRLNPEVLSHYDTGLEQERLLRGAGELERARIQDLLARVLPPAPAIVIDVGGGAGVHALWLAERGYEVHLVDAVPLHVEQARVASAGADRPLASISLGDARELAWPDEHADAVLLFGPLYHLVERADRLRALREAHRVVRRGGLVLTAAVSRAARRDDRGGAPRRALGRRRRPRVLAAGFDGMWADVTQREWLLDTLRSIEEEPMVVAASAHPVGVGRRLGVGGI